jgi:hypothetical protein
MNNACVPWDSDKVFWIEQVGMSEEKQSIF